MVLGAVGESLLQLDFASVAQMTDAAGDSQTGRRTHAARRSSRRPGSPGQVGSPGSVASTERSVRRWRRRLWRSRPPGQRWPGSPPPTASPASHPSSHRRRRTRCRCRDQRRGRVRRRLDPSRSRRGIGTRRACRQPPTSSDRWSPGSRRGHSGRRRRSGSCRSAAPGPTSGPHQPGLGCPGSTGPLTCESPLKACRTSTAFEARAFSLPQVS